MKRTPESRYGTPEQAGLRPEEVLVHHLLTHTSGYQDEDLALFMAEHTAQGPTYPAPEEAQHPLVNVYLTLAYPAPLWKRAGMIMS